MQPASRQNAVVHSPLPASPLYWLTRIYSRVMITAYARPTLFRPQVWLLALALGVLGVLVLAILAYWLLLVLPVALLGVVILGILGWRRLMRPSSKTVLAVISRLHPSTAGAFETTINHQLAILDALASAELVDLVEPRKLSPIRRSEAEAVIAACPVRVVMYGEARVPGTQWLATGGILVDSSPSAVDPHADRWVASPTRHEAFRDPDLELNALAGDFTADHVDILRAEVLNLATALGS
jgi:hypothetical protein